ncbi:MAG: TlpA family protein disulfide reductase [Anaerolineales bacterium]|nr:TlpA family protein disulfide reductase [Anaerolineales bacterium]
MAQERKNGKTWVLALLMGILLVLLVFLALPLLRTQDNLLPGNEAPDFAFTDFENRSHTLSSYRGQVVVLNFWASWCDPCTEEAAILEKAYQNYKDQGVIFLGIAYSDTERESRAYLESNAITYPNGPDLGTKISTQYRVGGVPGTFIIDPQGNLSAIKIGPFTGLEELEALILQAQ